MARSLLHGERAQLSNATLPGSAHLSRLNSLKWRWAAFGGAAARFLQAWFLASLLVGLAVPGTTRQRRAFLEKHK